VNTTKNTEMLLCNVNEVGAEINAGKVGLIEVKAEVCIVLWHWYC
jgi:hypothetical protein